MRIKEAAEALAACANSSLSFKPPFSLTMDTAIAIAAADYISNPLYLLWFLPRRFVKRIEMMGVHDSVVIKL
jgi:hypothetical protein